ncbi:MAG TPA: type II toxin-antitoxin system PemK/MazF family toxin [Bacillota bacterium]|jgi:mRNA interferase MazF|nr:type II toxin-antitoxin system PemK/MazF family toxin [Bacillota bacterium]
MIHRGDIFYANLNPVLGSEQGGLRPVLIIQNDVGNMYSPTTIIAAITSKIKRAKLPTHIEISAARYRLEKDSVILLEQLRTIDRQRLKERIARLDDVTMLKVNEAIAISLGLKELN